LTKKAARQSWRAGLAFGNSRESPRFQICQPLGWTFGRQFDPNGCNWALWDSSKSFVYRWLQFPVIAYLVETSTCWRNQKLQCHLSHMWSVELCWKSNSCIGKDVNLVNEKANETVKRKCGSCNATCLIDTSEKDLSI
jgi:hypothetical protein